MAGAITHSVMGQSNRAAALRLIRRSGGISRVALSERLGLSRAAVTNIASGLVNMGIVRDDVSANLARDLPRSMLHLNPDWGFVVTVNMTHNLAVGAVNMAGEVVSWRRLEGDDHSHVAYRDRFEELLLPAVQETLDQLRGKQVLGVGVLSYGEVDRSGLIRESVSLPRRDTDMAEVLAPVTDLPVRVDHEFRLLLLAHMWRSDPARFSNAVAMSGKLCGLGGAQAMIVEGNLCYGKDGFAGQYGWVKGAPYSGPEMAVMDARIAQAGGPGVFFQRLRDCDVEACELYRKAVANYGFRLAHIIDLLNTEHVLLYAAYFALGQRFLDDVRAETAKVASPKSMAGVEIRFGGGRTDEEHLTAAAMPLLMEFYARGCLDVTERQAGGLAPGAAQVAQGLAVVEDPRKECGHEPATTGMQIEETLGC